MKTSKQIIKRNWSNLFCLNFVGVLNDNFMKHSIIFVATLWQLPDYLNRSTIISIISASLVIPYILLSPFAGDIAQRKSKQRIINIMKWIEIPIVLFAFLGFYFKSIVILALSILLMGIQSCMYSPAKYGLIRDIEGENKVAFGSGIFEMMAFLGILLGTLLAGFVADHYTSWIVGLIMIILAALGILLSKSLKINEEIKAKERESHNPILFLINTYKFTKEYHSLNSAIFGASLLWLVGGLLQMNVILHCTNTLSMNNTTSGIVLSMAAIGIALGCSITGIILKNKNPNIFIILGLVGVSLCMFMIIIFKPANYILHLLIFSTGVCGSLFQVPCLTIIQKAPIGNKLASVLAYVNLLTFIFVLIGAVIFSISTSLTNENSYIIFGIIAILCIISIPLYINQNTNTLPSEAK